MALHSGRTPRLAGLAAPLVLAGLACLTSANASAATDFDAVQPLLTRECVLCHHGAYAPLGLKLDSLAGVLAGSTRGPVVKAGNAADSELVKRLDGRSQPRMPLTGPPYVSDAELALVRAWIDQGLQPGTQGTAASTGATVGAGVQAASAASALQVEPLPTAHAASVVSTPPTWRDVAPVFATRCTKCHAAQGLMGPAPEGYLLTSHAAATSAQDRVRIVPGRPQSSELLRRIKGQALPRMPLDGPPYLSDGEIALVEAWIAAGARDSLGQPAPMPVGARIRLRGVLAADGTLDGLELPAPDAGQRRGGGGGGGRRDRGAPAGGAVELRGSILPDGGIAVERLRGR